VNNELVSVIMPAYNSGKYIEGAIESVLKQTYPYFELIIVDDGSKDRTSEIVKSFKDTRIVFIQHSQNRGVSEARNSALRAAKGKWIALIDADDQWLPERLEELIKILNKSGEGYFVTDDHIICFDTQDGLKPWDSALTLYYGTVSDGKILDLLLLDFLKTTSLPLHPIFPANCVKFYNLGYNPKLHFAEDFEFYCNLFRIGLKLKLYKKAFYVSRLTSGSLIGSEKSIRGAIDALNILLHTGGFTEEERYMLRKLLSKEVKESHYKEFTYYLKRRQFTKSIEVLAEHPLVLLKFFLRLPISLRYRLDGRKNRAYLK